MTVLSTVVQDIGNTELATKSHLLPDDAKLIEATASILERHESVELEANIRDQQPAKPGSTSRAQSASTDARAATSQSAVSS